VQHKKGDLKATRNMIYSLIDNSASEKS